MKKFILLTLISLITNNIFSSQVEYDEYEQAQQAHLAYKEKLKYQNKVYKVYGTVKTSILNELCIVVDDTYGVGQSWYRINSSNKIFKDGDKGEFKFKIINRNNLSWLNPADIELLAFEDECPCGDCCIQ